MAKKQLQLIYALKDGKAAHISEVESGKKCGCVCPACGEPLVAKKGSKNLHHFAHANNNCEYGYETSLHLAAKEILSEAKKIFLPEVFLEFPNSTKKTESLVPAKEISIDDVKLEQRYGDIIPDIVVFSGGKEFFVEIFVTHRIDDEKLEKLQKAAISTIEIDLSKQSKTITKEELSQILLCDNALKTWKYNAFASPRIQHFYKTAEKFKIVSRGKGNVQTVVNCPLKLRLCKGEFYAKLGDCLSCEYCIEANPEEKFIRCSGRLRIASLDDFRKPLEERIQNSELEIKSRIRGCGIQAMFSGCPDCGGRLLPKYSQDGKFRFLGCSNYPTCKVMFIIDPLRGFVRKR